MMDGDQTNSRSEIRVLKNDGWRSKQVKKGEKEEREESLFIKD